MFYREAREQKEYEQAAILNLMRVSKREQSFILNDIKKEKGRQHQVVSQNVDKFLMDNKYAIQVLIQPSPVLHVAFTS